MANIERANKLAHELKDYGGYMPEGGLFGDDYSQRLFSHIRARFEKYYGLPKGFLKSPFGPKDSTDQS